MKNKSFKNEEIFGLIVKERVLSIAIFFIITHAKWQIHKEYS